MKRNFTWIFALLFSAVAFSQTDIKNTSVWDLRGNVVTNNNYFLGSKNNIDLTFKANNIEVVKLFTHGGVRFAQYNSATDYLGVSVAGLGISAQGDVLTTPILLTKSTTNVSATPTQYVAGNLQIRQSNGVILTSENGTKYRLKVSDNGALILELVTN